QMTAMELQDIFNHPLVRNGADKTATQRSPEAAPAHVVGVRIYRNPVNKNQLWMARLRSDHTMGEGKAFTHHNVAALQHSGAFQPHLDVCLSLDNRRLSILDKKNKHEESITIDVESFDEDLAKASTMLTEALKDSAIESPVETRSVSEKPVVMAQARADVKPL